MGKKILVVDDAAFMRLIIRDILVGGGYEVVGEAEDGNQAVAMYKALSPDIVLMDITMPEKNGIVAVQEILADDPQAKIIMVSAMGQQAMVIQSIKSGAMDFVVKPFHSDRVLGSIEKALAKAEAW